jgi:YVTN family beta-propeller protein
MRNSSKWTTFAILAIAASVAAQDAGPRPTPVPVPPTLRLPIASLVPDATVALGGDRQLVATSDGVWVTNRAAGTLTRIDAKTNAMGTPIAVGKAPCAAVVSAFQSIWTPLCGGPGLARVEVATAAAAKAGPSGEATGTATAPAPVVKVIATSINNAGPVAQGTGSIWMITDAAGTLARIDPDTNAVVAEVSIAAGASALAFGDDAVFVASVTQDTLTRVNGHTNVVTEIIKVGRGPSAVTVGSGAVWTLNSGDGTVSRIDSKTNKVIATIKAGVTASGGSIVVGEGSVWLSAPGTPLTRIDPVTNHVLQQFSGPGGGAMAVGLKSLWIAATPTAIWRVDPKRVEATRK